MFPVNYLSGLLLGFLLILGTWAGTCAQTDTLRHWTPGRPLISLSSMTPLSLQVARFELAAPCTLRRLILHTAGGTGSLRVHLFGHEGGTAFPQFLTEVRPAQTLRKEADGPQQLVYEPVEPIYFDNNQFFVGVSNLSEGVRLLADGQPVPDICESTDGGNYYHIFFRNEGRWGASPGAYAIDAIVDVPQAQSPRWFEDVTAAAGLNGSLSNASMAWEDYDGDGYLDLLVVGRLYRNLGSGRFEDRTQAAGLTGSPRANVWIDLDNDRDWDILFLGLADAGGRSRLFLNDGQGQFTARELSGLEELRAPTGVSIADLNGDGLPDVFVCQLWDPYPEPWPNYLLLNDGQLGLTIANERIYPGITSHRRSRGTSFVDFDQDGDLDLYVVNYFLEQDELWENDGAGHFLDIARRKDIDRNRTGSNHGTGCDWGDFDADGDLDLLLCQFAHPNFTVQYDHRGTTIYENLGGPQWNFRDLRDRHGIQFEETHAGGTWGDVNNDGLLDFFITTYYGCRYVDLYHQNPDHSFSIRSFDYGIDRIVSGEDAVWVDYDNDGRLDLCAGDRNRLRLWRNASPIADRNWLQLELRSPDPRDNYFAIGAKARLVAGDYRMLQEVVSGRGQRMQKPTRLHFGLGDRPAIEYVEVEWPDSARTTERFWGLSLNQRHTLTKGQGAAVSRLPAGELAALQAGPNPASGSLTLRNLPEGRWHASLYDLQGRRLLSHELPAAPTATLDLAGLSAGVYVLEVSGAGVPPLRMRVLVQ